MPAHEDAEIRFWRKVRKEPSRCWLWTGLLKENGYASFSPVHGQQVYAHRWLYERLHGLVPNGLRLHHTCHMMHCVNPEHLILLTPKETVNRQPRPTSLVTRFWAQVEKTDGCWLWKGKVGVRGYGTICVKDHTVMAHRLSWELHFEPIEDGLYVCHHCDNKRCVRPDHLFLGTAKDNMQDALAKGRIATGDRSWSRLHPERLARGDRSGMRTHPEKVRRGADVNTAKLTAEKVKAIRARFASGETNQSAFAREFGVTHAAIWRILHGDNWKHV